MTRGKSNRRGILALIGGIVVVAGLPMLWLPLAPAPGTMPHPRVAGFQMLEGGAVSAVQSPFIGLDAPDPGAIAPAPITDPCAALFGRPTTRGNVPIAYFTDINCPYCRVMEPWLATLPTGLAALNWHDTPLLGPSSVAGARAIAAAGLQGAETEMRTRLHRTRFQLDAAYLTALAEGMGLDAPRLLADMTSPEVEARIADSLGLAQVFGIPGTPALVVGDTLVIGQQTQAGLRDLIDAAYARRDRWPCPAGSDD